MLFRARTKGGKVRSRVSAGSLRVLGARRATATSRAFLTLGGLLSCPSYQPRYQVEVLVFAGDFSGLGPHEGAPAAKAARLGQAGGLPDMRESGGEQFVVVSHGPTLGGPPVEAGAELGTGPGFSSRCRYRTRPAPAARSRPPSGDGQWRAETRSRRDAAGSRPFAASRCRWRCTGASSRLRRGEHRGLAPCWLRHTRQVAGLPAYP